MRAIYKAPGLPAQEVEVKNELHEIQKILKGYIEAVWLSETEVLLVNEEGKLRAMRPNFWIGGELIVGPALFVGSVEDDFTDYPLDLKEWREKYDLN